MVDFRKRLTKKAAEKQLDPLAIYETLDRASDKGELRKAQEFVLKTWHAKLRNNRDLIVKLHTGQGKTLIGLLMLQSKLNENSDPALFLCANNFLVNQTCTQAQQFGVPYCTAGKDLPEEFLDGESILITSVHKLFNGLTKFKMGPHSTPISTILMDDCHACIDSIRDCFSIRLSQSHPAYTRILSLFSNSLAYQGAGTYADISNGSHSAISPIPYWDWQDKQTEVVKILSKHTTGDEIKFVWPLIKDNLGNCQCVVSGESLEISPYLPPLELFGSYYNAKARIFMSATVTDDSFLIRGLRLSASTIKNPLNYEKEHWSGEKMILIPSLIDPALDRPSIVSLFGKPHEGRRFGTVALIPSFKNTKDWEAYGARVATRETIDHEIEKLRNGEVERTLTIANRYDGIDLPDQVCRILIIDGKPYSDSLIDRYSENCRAFSEVTAIRTARTVEQGLGRSVRGEKDYSVIVLIGSELVRTVKSKTSRKHLSSQTQMQVAIGLQIAEMAKEEASSTKALTTLIGLVNQCLKRDADWKAFYSEKMEAVKPRGHEGKVLEIFELELAAESKFQEGKAPEAIDILQHLIDKYITDNSDKGWYLQEMARYKHSISHMGSNKLQLEAHRKNRFLMRPREGMQIDKIIVSQKRVANIIKWISSFDNYEELIIAVDDLVGRLKFGVSADRFEQAFDELGKALGFTCQRPDKEWKEGPDNLWGLRDGEFLLVECKSEVDLKRAEIYKSETGQMSNACVWFAKNYSGAKAKKIIIIPTNKIGKGAGFSDSDVEVMREQELAKLIKSTRVFFGEFASVNFKDLSEKQVQAFLENHHLSVDALIENYSKAIAP